MNRSRGKSSGSHTGKKDTKTSEKSPNSYALLKRGLEDVESALKRKKMEEEKKKESANKKDRKESYEVIDYNIPTRTYGDLYCKACDSHMNSEQMWEAHITGKRHIKNVKKGEIDQKYDVINVEPTILPQINEVKEPIVGLKYICEIRRNDPKIGPLYQCFLCNANLSSEHLVIEHIIGLKHRLAYVKENAPEIYNLIDSIKLKKGYVEPLVLENVAKLETQFGRGSITVKKERPKTDVWRSSKEDTGPPKSSNTNRNDKEKASNWKHLDYEKDAVPRERVESRERSGDRYLVDRKTQSSYDNDKNRLSSREKHYRQRDSLSPVKTDIRSNIHDKTYQKELDSPLHSKVFVATNRHPNNPIPAYPDAHFEASSPLSERPIHDYSTCERRTGTITYDHYKKFDPNSEDYKRTSATSQTGIDPMIDLFSKMDAVPESTFLSFVVFKMDKMKSVAEEDLVALQKIIQHATRMTLNVKLRNFTPDIRKLFVDCMNRNGLRNVDFDQLNQLLLNAEQKNTAPPPQNLPINETASRNQEYASNFYGSNLSHDSQMHSNVENTRYFPPIGSERRALQSNVSQPPQNNVSSAVRFSTQNAVENILNAIYNKNYSSPPSNVKQSGNPLPPPTTSSGTSYSLFGQREQISHSTPSSTIPGLTLTEDMDYNPGTHSVSSNNDSLSEHRRPPNLSQWSSNPNRLFNSTGYGF